MLPNNNQRPPLSYSSGNLAIPRFLQASPLMYPSAQSGVYGLPPAQGFTSGYLPNYMPVFQSSQVLPPQNIISYTNYSAAPSKTVISYKTLPPAEGPSQNVVRTFPPVEIVMPQSDTIAHPSVTSSKAVVSPTKSLICLAPRAPLGELNGESSRSSKPTSLADIPPQEEKAPIFSETPKSAAARSRLKGELVSIRVAEIEDHIQKRTLSN